MATSARGTTTIYQTSTISYTTTRTTPAPETTSGIVTAWIPLTTVAPPPLSACWNESFTNDYDGTAFDSVPVAFDPDFGFQVGSSYIGCQPSEVTIWFDGATASLTKGALATVTSIQPVVCPSMWSTARTSTVRNSVQVTCCPSGYTADTNDDHGVQANCASSMTPSQTFAYLNSNQSTVTTAFSTSITVAAVAIKGWNSIVTTSAHLSSSSSSSSSFSTTSSSTSSASSIGSATEPSGVPHSSGIHGGAATGIFVGVFAAVALIGVGIFMFLRRRRQGLATDNISGGNRDISDLKSGQYVNVPQSPNHRLSELPTASNTPEIYTDYHPHSPLGNDGEIHELQ